MPARRVPERQLEDRLLGRRRRDRASPTIVPPCITAIRSLMPRISGSSDEIIRMARPSPASSLISRWISALAPTSTPCVGSSRIRTRRRRPPASAPGPPSAGCRPRGCPPGVSSDGVLIPSWSHEPGGGGALAAEVEQAEPRDRRGASPAWCWPPSTSRGSRRAGGGPRGRRRSPSRRPAPGESIATGRPRSRISPASAGVRPKRTRASSVRPAPTRPASPRISPARTLQVDVADARRPAAQPADLQHHLARLDGDLGEDGRELAADHHPDQLAAGDLGHPPRPDQDAVAQGRHAVGDLGAAPPAGARCR